MLLYFTATDLDCSHWFRRTHCPFFIVVLFLADFHLNDCFCMLLDEGFATYHATSLTTTTKKT